MKHMSLAEIASASGGLYIGDPALRGREISSVTIDSRKVEKDSLFIAIKGSRVDGHSFIPQTIADGALCALSEQDLGETPFPYIRVASCTQALKDIAAYYRSVLDIKVIGISGSVGKTSTKEMIASVLSQKYNVLKTEGNFNNEIGLPLTVLRIREEHEAAVLEMGISDFGEMTRLAQIARPDICVITNIGCAHLEHLGSRDGILRAKTEMLAFMNPQGSILFNGDDDKLRSFRPENGVRPVYFGLGEDCSFHAGTIRDLGLDGTLAELITPRSHFTAHIPIPGDHMVYNALAGAAAGYALGMTDEEIRAGIEALVPLAGRNNLIRTERFSIIDDCYNANPASMRSSLNVLAKAAPRRVAVLGDMFELGSEKEQMHHSVGLHAAEAGIEVLICIGTLSAAIADGARQASHGAMEIHHYSCKEDFFADMRDLLKTGDTILVKASHGMGFSEIVKKLQD